MNEKSKLGIIADDLTGALDTGVQFSKWGLESLVTLTNMVPPDVPCVVINTDSRAERPEMASERVKQAARLLRGRFVYKKIDSTLRGNIGIEVRQAMEELGATKAVVVPAFPANGRTIVGGRLYVHGVPLEQTAFARDPRNAVRHSHIPTLLREQLAEEIGAIALNMVENGPEAIAAAVAATPQRIIVLDAATHEHLVIIGLAVLRSAGAWLPVGSAGLAEGLALALGLQRQASLPVRLDAQASPILLVAGSRNEVSAAQLREAMAVLDWPIVQPDPARLSDPLATRDEIERVAEVSGQYLGTGQSVIITTCFAAEIPGGSARIAEGLGLITRHILSRYPAGGLFLTGGDIALQVCRALSAQALRPIAEILPGLPYSRLVSGLKHDLHVVTKAGGFGEKDAIIVGARFLRGEIRSDDRK